MKRATPEPWLPGAPPPSPPITTDWLLDESESYAAHLMFEMDYQKYQLDHGMNDIDSIFEVDFGSVAIREQRYRMITLRYELVVRDIKALVQGAKRPHWRSILL